MDTQQNDREPSSPKLVDELKLAKLVAVRALSEVCNAVGVPVETQVLAAKTLLEFKPDTVRLKPLP